MVNVGAPPTLLLNQGGNGNHRVLFKLVGSGKKSNRSAIGARVTVKAGKVGAVQRGPRRGQLHFTKRSAVALRPGSGNQNDRSGDQVAQRQDGSAARRAGGFYLYDGRRPGDRGQDSASTAVFAVQVVPSFRLPATFPASVCACPFSSSLRRAPRVRAGRHPDLRSGHGLHRLDRTELLRLALLLRHPTHLAIACLRQSCNN